MTFIKGYFRKDGTFVPSHQDKRTAEPYMPGPRHDHLPEWLKEPGEVKTKFYPNAKPHPQRDKEGESVSIHEPSTPTPPETWGDPDAIATFTPGEAVPKILNGVPLEPWLDHPTDDVEWDAVEGQDPFVEDYLPPMKLGYKAPAAGVIIEEEDGRVWVIHPTNGFGGYKATFPKGHLEDEINLQATAIKEAYEESGLKVEITGFAMDVDRSTTVCRYFTAKRVGGTPAAMGWESQAVSLVPRKKLYSVLNRSTDYPMAQSLGAGVPPPPPAMPKYPPIGKYGKENWSGGKPSTLFDDLNDFPLPPPKKAPKAGEPVRVVPKAAQEPRQQASRKPEPQKGIIPTHLPPPKLQKPVQAQQAAKPEAPEQREVKKSVFGWIGDKLRGRWGWS